jgi:Helix-turn-helix domain
MPRPRRAFRTRRASLRGTCRLPGSSDGLAVQSVVRQIAGRAQLPHAVVPLRKPLQLGGRCRRIRNTHSHLLSLVKSYSPHCLHEGIMIFFRKLRCEQEREHMRQRGKTTTFQTRLEISEYVTAGLNDTHIAAAVGCSVWTVRKWRRRALRQGCVGLASQIGRPATGPMSTFPHELREAILHLRTLHPGWDQLHC